VEHTVERIAVDKAADTEADHRAVDHTAADIAQPAEEDIGVAEAEEEDIGLTEAKPPAELLEEN
jgi:hypothetical protein